MSYATSRLQRPGPLPGVVVFLFDLVAQLLCGKGNGRFWGTISSTMWPTRFSLDGKLLCQAPISSVGHGAMFYPMFCGVDQGYMLSAVRMSPKCGVGHAEALFTSRYQVILFVKLSPSRIYSSVTFRNVTIALLVGLRARIETRYIRFS